MERSAAASRCKSTSGTLFNVFIEKKEVKPLMVIASRSTAALEIFDEKEWKVTNFPFPSASAPSPPLPYQTHFREGMEHEEKTAKGTKSSIKPREMYGEGGGWGRAEAH